MNQSIREAIQTAFEQAGGRGLPGAVAAGESEDVRAAAHQDYAARTEGPEGGGLNIHIDLT